MDNVTPRNRPEHEIWNRGHHQDTTTRESRRADRGEKQIINAEPPAGEGPGTAEFKLAIFQVRDPNLRGTLMAANRAVETACNFFLEQQNPSDLGSKTGPETLNDLPQNSENPVLPKEASEVSPKNANPADKPQLEIKTSTPQNLGFKGGAEEKKLPGSLDLEKTVMFSYLKNGEAGAEANLKTQLEKLKGLKDQSLFDFEKSLCFVEDAPLRQEFEKLSQRLKNLENPKPLSLQENVNKTAESEDFSFSRNPEARKILSGLHSMLNNLSLKMPIIAPAKNLVPIKSRMGKVRIIWVVAVASMLALGGMLYWLL